MGAGSAAEVAEHVVRSGAAYTVQGTAEEQAEGTRRIEAEILRLRSVAAEADTIAQFEAALAEIENGIRILRAQPRPDQTRIDWWRQRARSTWDESSQPAWLSSELFSKNIQPYCRRFRHLSFDQGSECPGGMRARFAKGTNRIRGIGRLSQSWLGFRRMCRIDAALTHPFVILLGNSRTFLI